MQWKHDLIARVEARVHGDPIPLSKATKVEGQTLTAENAKSFEYTRVRITGHYNAEGTALVRAATERGMGYWTLAPLQTEDGQKLWINRGFVPAGTVRAKAAETTPVGAVQVVGLLRPSEAGGSLLQANQPQTDRWYSRDVKALAEARNVGEVLPFFIDAQEELTKEPQASKPADALKPVAGLTQVQFADNHLMYMLTWFTLAILSAGALVFVWRRA